MTTKISSVTAAYSRAPTQPEHFLGKQALRLLASLPAEVFPCELARRFPRIVNQLALDWGDTTKTVRYLQGLLVSDRPGRQGFPPAVVRELIALGGHYESVACPASRPASVWEHDPHTLRH